MKEKEKLKKFLNTEMSEIEEKKIWEDLDSYEFEQKFRAYVQEREKVVRYIVPTQYLTPVWINRPILARAAAVLVLVTASWLGFNHWTTPQYERLLADYSAEEVPSVVTRMGLATDTYWNSAELAYRNHKFEEAIVLIKKINTTQALSPQQHFYFGICLMRQSQKDNIAAIQQLLKAREQGDGWNKEEITWNLALAYSDNKQFSESREELTTILTKQQTTNHQAEAKKLLDALPEK